MIALQFVLGSGISSRLIAWYGESVDGFSHVDAVLSDGSLLGARSDKIGGKPPGVQIRPPDYEKWLKRERWGLIASEADEAAWEQWLKLQVGKPYDSGSIIGFLLGRAEHDRGHWICSALQTQGLRSIGRLKNVPLPGYAITPNSLRLMFCALGAIKVTP